MEENFEIQIMFKSTQKVAEIALKANEEYLFLKKQVHVLKTKKLKWEECHDHLEVVTNKVFSSLKCVFETTNSKERDYSSLSGLGISFDLTSTSM